MAELSLTCQRVTQNQQEFFLGVFPIRRLLEFTTYTKRLIRYYDDENIPQYNDQIQRHIENGRVEKIADFLTMDPEAMFPTNIVLHIPSQVIERQKFEGDSMELTLSTIVKEGVEAEKKKPDHGHVYITIIDGQHRVKGIQVAIDRLQQINADLAKTLEKNPRNAELQKRHTKSIQRLNDLMDIKLVVTFFIDKTIDYQAMVFSTINRTQKKVSESLVSSLFGLSSEPSPQRTALEVVLALNASSTSPFFNRLKLYGGDYGPNQSPPLTQAMLVKSLVGLISENPREAEKDRFRDRKELNKRSSGSAKELPFRKYYAQNNDVRITQILNAYFSAVRDVFTRPDGKSYWTFDSEVFKPSNVLQTTVGYQGLLQILVDLLPEVAEDDRDKKEVYHSRLKLAKGLPFEDVKHYPFTSKSKYILHLDVSLRIWPKQNELDERYVKLQLLLGQTE